MKAVASEHASDWLNAIPAEGLGLKLDNTSIRICVGLRLGAPICQPFSCPCGGVIDKQGRHPLSCKFSKGRHPRHSHSNDIIKRAMGSADIPAILEPQGLSKTDNERPDGLSLFPWKSGKCVVWDYTCTCTLSWSNTEANCEDPGKPAEKAERRKLAKYEYLTSDYIFIPIANETMGTWGKLGLDFIKELG